MLKWLLAAIAAITIIGCTDWNEPYRPHGGGQGGGNGQGQGHGHGSVVPATEKLTERTDWRIKYLGRADYTEEDGSVSRVEEFSFNYTGSGYFIVRAYTADDMASFYDNDIKSMIKGEVEYEVSLAENEGIEFYENTNSVFNADTKTVFFDLIIHGDYTAYLIEINKDGKPTYNYAKSVINVEEESPSEGFLQWIGSWHVTDGSVGYDIVVSSCEANYLYYVDGWETGDAVQEQMTQERDWIFARYRSQDSNLSFYGQYLMSYEEGGLQDSQGNNVWVDQMFVGTYLTASSDKNGEVDAEGAYSGYDIAHTVRQVNGQVILEPERFTFDNGFEAVYHSMRYSRFCYDEENWLHYNDTGVPTFTNHTMVMEPLPGTKASIVHRRTKEMVKRTQPQAHVDKGASRVRAAQVLSYKLGRSSE